MVGDIREAEGVPVVGTHLRKQLETIEPSLAGSCEYRPCRVLLASREWRDCVYLVEAISYIENQGLWPWELPGWEYLPLDDVLQIENSPTRLPAVIATKIARAGETRMGYHVFTLLTADGLRIPRISGNPDWVELPNGVRPQDIIDVIPHEGRSKVLDSHSHGKAFAWCLYRLPA